MKRRLSLLSRCFGITATLLFLFNFSSLSQSNDWEFLLEKDGVKIYHKTSNCDLERGFDEKRVLLKFENTNGKKASLMFHKDLFYNGECVTCDDPNGEYSCVLSVGPNSSIEPECSIHDPSYHWIFVEWANRPNETTLTDFQLTDVAVSFDGVKPTDR